MTDSWHPDLFFEAADNFSVVEISILPHQAEKQSVRPMVRGEGCDPWSLRIPH